MPSAPCVSWTSRWTAMPARSSLGAVSLHLAFCPFFLFLVFSCSDRWRPPRILIEQNVNEWHSPVMLQTPTPSVRLCTPGRKAPCPRWRCLRSPPACCSTTSLVRRCQARGWNPTQVMRDCISTSKIKIIKNDFKILIKAFLLQLSVLQVIFLFKPWKDCNLSVILTCRWICHHDRPLSPAEENGLLPHPDIHSLYHDRHSGSSLLLD